MGVRSIAFQLLVLFSCTLGRENILPVPGQDDRLLQGILCLPAGRGERLQTVLSTNLVALQGYDSVIPLAWSPDGTENLIAYDIHKSSSESGPFVKIARVDHPYFRDENIANNSRQYYKVNPVYQAGPGSFSPVASAVARASGNRISSPFVEKIPVLDGIIGTEEWREAFRKDIKLPEQDQPVRMYIMNSQNSLYVAINELNDPVLSDYDAVGIFFDEDADREWSATDGEEGLLALYWDDRQKSARNLYYSFHGQWPTHESVVQPSPVPGVQQAISVSSGHMQYEIAIDLINSPVDIAAGQPMGVLVYVFSYTNDSGGITGLWPQEPFSKLEGLTEGNRWAHGPFSYGDLLLSAREKKQFWADVDQDQDVDIFDIQLVASLWNISQIHPDYNPLYDVNDNGLGDGIIDIFDIQMVAFWWNKPSPEAMAGKRVAEVQNQGAMQLYCKANPSREIEIWADNTKDLSGIQFDLVFKAPIKANSIEWNGLLNENNVLVLPPQYSDEKKRITLGSVWYGISDGLNGSIRLLTFAPETWAEIPAIENVKCSDPQGNRIPVMSVGIHTDEMNTAARPETFELLQNNPNPFNPQTTIHYHLKRPAKVKLAIFNMNGQRIKILVNEQQPAGTHAVHWHGKDRYNAQVPSGIYVYRLECDDKVFSKKMVLVK